MAKQLKRDRARASRGKTASRQKRSKKPETRYQELQTLQEISQVVLTSLDIQTILERILDKALLVGSFDVGVIRLLDGSDKILQPAAHRGYRDLATLHSKTTDPKDEATGMILVQVMAAKGAYQIEDVPSSQGMRSFKKEGVRSAIVVPVRAGEEILGVIQLGSRTPRRLRPKDIYLLESIGSQMGLAVQKARLFEESNRRRKNAEALREIGLSLTARHDPQQLLDQVAEEARRLVGALFTFVVVPDKPFYRFVAVAGDDRGYGEVLKLSDDPASPYGQGPLGRAIRTRKSVVCEDVLSDPLFVTWREIASERGIRSLVAVPLLVQKKPYGAILVYSPIPRAYEAETLDLLGLLAAQAGAALENARLFEETRRRAQEQAALNVIAKATSQSLRRDELLEIALDKVLEVTGRERVSIRLKDPVTGKVALAAHRGFSQEEIEDLRYRMPHRPSDQVFASGQPLVCNDRSEVQDSQSLLQDSRSVAWIPMKAGAIVVGILGISASQPVPFSQHEVELLQAIGNVIGVALENARLYEETERRRREAEELARVAQSLTETLDMTAVADRVVTSIREILEIRTSTLRLLQPDGSLRSVASRDQGSVRSPGGGEAIPPGMGLTGRAIAEGRPVWSADMLSDPAVPLTDQMRDSQLRAGNRSMLAVPLRARGKVIGALALSDQKGRSYSDREVALVQTFADQAALALDNTRLYEEARTRETQLQETNRRLSALYSVTAVASQSLDLDRVLEAAIEKITEIFQFGATRIHLYGEQTDELILRAAFVRSPELAPTNRTFKRGQGIVGTVGESGKALIFEDTRTDPLYRQLTQTRLAGQSGRRFFAVFPIKGKLKILGTLNCIGLTPRTLTPGEVQLLEALIGQIAVAVENSGLYEELRQKVAALQQKTAELAEANNRQADFAAMIAHDLRSPLTNVVSTVTMMQDGLFGLINEEQWKWLAKIEASVQRLVELVNDFLDLSKIEAGQIGLLKEEVDIGQLILDTLDNHRLLAESRKISLVNRLQLMRPSVHIDSRRVEQVLINLLANAVKFTGEGGTIEVGAYKDGDAGIKVYVKDSGVGIPADEIGSLFEKYRQTTSGKTSKDKGTGLGLVICKMIVEAHGGRIWVESEEGKGSTFTVTIPCQS